MLSVPEMTDADASRIIAEEACILIEVLLITSLMFSKTWLRYVHNLSLSATFPDTTGSVGRKGEGTN